MAFKFKLLNLYDKFVMKYSADQLLALMRQKKVFYYSFVNPHPFGSQRRAEVDDTCVFF